MAGISRAYKRRNNMVANTGAPVLCLDAGSRISYPGSGTTWTDLSGNSNTGTLTNGPTYSSANGGSIVFDGSNDYVGLTASASLNGLTDFTFSAWAYFNTSSITNGFLFVSGDAAFEFWRYQGKFRFYYQGADFNTTDSVPTGQWVLMMLTRSGSVFKQYINDTLSKTTTINATAWPSAGYRIGAYTSGGYNLNGLISSVSIYNRALSAAEISQNFNLLRGRYGI